MVTYPLLLVKARLQSAGKHTSSDRKYSGTLDAIERIYRTEGGAAPVHILPGGRAMLGAPALLHIHQHATASMGVALSRTLHAHLALRNCMRICRTYAQL